MAILIIMATFTHIRDRLSSFCFVSAIGAGWNPAFSDTFYESDLYYSEQRFLSDSREYWLKGRFQSGKWHIVNSQVKSELLLASSQSIQPSSLRGKQQMFMGVSLCTGLSRKEWLDYIAGKGRRAQIELQYLCSCARQ